MGHQDAQWVFHNDLKPDNSVPGINRRVLAYCAGCMCVENTFQAGAVGPLHSHPHTQITYVAEGEFQFTIGDETKTVKKGDSMLKQNEVVHGCQCISEGILVDFFTPMREDFVQNK